MSQTHKRNSIYVKLIGLLIGAALIAGLLFFVALQVGDHLVDSYFQNSKSQKERNQGYVQKLTEEIQAKDLKTTDVKEISRWVKKQKIISIDIYQNNILVYDSEYPEEVDIRETRIPLVKNEWTQYYDVEFGDGETVVSVYGLYDYQAYNYALIVELVLAFLVFLSLVMLGIRRKMNYIRTLSREIEILEGGNLEYPITVSGKDELSSLAYGLDCMRQSFRNQVIQEAQLVSENKRIITEMSHDLRTPITSVLLYTTILKKEKELDASHREEYIDKIEKKAVRMKNLTDHLFEYALVTGEEEVSLEKPEQVKVVFYDLISETCNYLEQKGFCVDTDLKWSERKIQVSMEYLTRIMDNVMSNIIKYARKSESITIRLVEDEKRIGFCFGNKRKHDEEEIESTGIGINSIKNMMAQMGGNCSVKEREEEFFITIFFPTCS